METQTKFKRGTEIRKIGQNINYVLKQSTPSPSRFSQQWSSLNKFWQDFIHWHSLKSNEEFIRRYRAPDRQLGSTHKARTFHFIQNSKKGTVL